MLHFAGAFKRKFGVNPSAYLKEDPALFSFRRRTEIRRRAEKIPLRAVAGAEKYY